MALALDSDVLHASMMNTQPDPEWTARRMVTLSGFPTALDEETKVDTSAASEAILQWVRDHRIWVGPVVFLLSFLESFAFISLGRVDEFSPVDAFGIPAVNQA
jgi:hypothetical protein